MKNITLIVKINLDAFFGFVYYSDFQADFHFSTNHGFMMKF